MHLMKPVWLIFSLSLMGWLTGCGSTDGAALPPFEASTLDHHECAACGMIVRNQPAPRAQLQHRNGERAFFCSVGDLLAYLDAPSPHGPAANVAIEVLGEIPTSPLPRTSSNQSPPWRDAGDLHYVVGVERTGIMGPPVLTFESRADADRMSRSNSGAQSVSWSQLLSWWTERSTP